MPSVASLPPRKKQKTVLSSVEVEIETLEQTLIDALTKGSSLNQLADLLVLATSAADPIITHKANYALYRLFVRIISAGKMRGNRQENEAAKTVRRWLSEQFSVYVDFLCSLMKDDQAALRVCISAFAFDVSA
jgi:U3 small nucleolar RNA-associated protein 19